MSDEEAKVCLVSGDEVSITVPLKVAKMSGLVNSMVGDDDNEQGEDASTKEIPLPNVTAAVLRKVIEFCEHHLQEPLSEIESPLKSEKMEDVVQKWYADFVEIDQAELFELLQAANYMHVEPLLNLARAKVSSMIKGKSPEDIRTTFNITEEFTPELEAKVRAENRWCEEA